MTQAEMLKEAESIACAEDWDSNGDKIRAIAQLVRDYAKPLADALERAVECLVADGYAGDFAGTTVGDARIALRATGRPS